MAKESRATTPPESNPPDAPMEDPQEIDVAAGSSDVAEEVKSRGVADSSDKMDEDHQTGGENAEDETGMTNDGEESRVQETADDGAPKAANAGANTTRTRSQPKKSKRKSTSGVPEHKARKLNKKKSSLITHTDAKPGDYYLARMKGHPIWPAIICDEEILTPTMLNSRGVSARRPDGTFRADYADGGKRVNERTFPVLFLATNEFAWMVNTDLFDLDLDAIEDQPKKPRKGAIDEAYKIAAEKHSLEWFKEVIKAHNEAIAAEEDEGAEAEEEQAKADAEVKRPKAKKRKSKAAAEEVQDVDMEDVDQMEFEDQEPEPEKKSKSKKRKKDVDSDGEDSKPAKTPKTAKKATKLKLSTPKTPNGSSANKSTAKGGSTAKTARTKATPGKKGTQKAKEEATEAAAEAAAEEESSEGNAKPEEKPLSLDEQREKRKKNLLYLRHKLQKGFLMRDQPPKEEDMAEMADYITKLESYDNLEFSMIRTTKINKVLKGIVKLSSIPKDEEYRFRQRSYELIQTWNQLMAKEPETPTAGASTEENGTGVNGVKVDKSDDEKADEQDTADVGKGDKHMEDAGDETIKKDEDATKSATSRIEAEETASQVEEKGDNDTTMAQPAEVKDESAEKEGDLGKQEDIEQTAEAVEPAA
ncbi:MAG: hypothetical protein M1816_002095 [Peltula sp. TS41687]|nr:MAG: hypothetical protein M1816_002095 [Peltula sp. TS41687]